MTATEKEMTQLLRRIYEAKTIGDARRLVVESLGDAILAAPTGAQPVADREPPEGEAVRQIDKPSDCEVNAFNCGWRCALASHSQVQPVADISADAERFFLDHGTWHDRETGRHLFYEGESPEASTISEAWTALAAAGVERDGCRTLSESIAKLAAMGTPTVPAR